MNQSMSKNISLILLSSLSVIAGTVLAANSNQTDQGNQYSNTQQNNTSRPAQIKWLGISLGQISPALRSQLSSQLKDGMGVMITGVQANSPAEKSGLKAFDILTRFNKTNVSNSQQVFDLVQQSSAGDKITLEYIRAGKNQTASAEIGSREVNQQQNWNGPFQGWPNGNRFGAWPNFNSNFNNDPFWNSQPRWNDPFFQNFNRNFQTPFNNFPSMPSFPDFPKDFGKNFNGKNGANVQSFSQSESLTMETLKNGKIHIEFKSKDTDNDEKRFVFEGKRDQIIKDIQQQKDLPEAQKQKLINAINGNFSYSFNSFNSNSLNNSSQGSLLPQIPSGPFSAPLAQPPSQLLDQQLEKQTPPKRLNY
ncbi:S1C family serine protease [uncultured Cocleimonas sp.]|uniref:S1C family serine protease n=1 Tax=uncultured Cocleimonas sp. TaxID=1051587 RepID=UPI002631495C|nr:PDZ domain-containing protein [uncultured Cocleimonas sp.]